MVELVNRARLDPLAEAARLSIDLNEGLAPDTLDGSVRQPLAGNVILGLAADDHSDWMLSTNTFSHQGADGSSPKIRMELAGYTFSSPWASGENIAWTGTTGVLDRDAAVFRQHDSLFRSSGHRENILNDTFREVGIGQSVGPFTYDGTVYSTSMITQNFAKSGASVFLTGVAFADTNENMFYDIGEALPGVGYAIGAAAAVSAAAGGYAVALASSGVETVRVSHPEGQTDVTVDFSRGNVKLDFVAGDVPMLQTSASAELLEPVDGQSVQTLQGLGAQGLRLAGNSQANTLRGTDGQDTLIGGAGDDFIFGGSGETDLRDVILAGAGNDNVRGGHGNDELRGDVGDDTIEGGFGVDLVIGGAGDDVLTGNAWSDQLFGGDGNDFLNGGFGFDRLNGGAGTDMFFHLGIPDHGSDWIQDFAAAEGDMLVYGGGAGAASVADFLVQEANTAHAGQADINELFVRHIPTGNILWALIDGAVEDEVNLMISGEVFNLLA